MEIQTVGQASSEVQWQFRRANEPLVGDQVLLQTVVFPKDRKKVHLEMQATAVIDPSVFRRPVRLDGPTVEFELALPTPE